MIRVVLIFVIAVVMYGYSKDAHPLNQAVEWAGVATEVILVLSFTARGAGRI